MPFNIVTSLSSLAILVLLVIEHPDLVNAKKNDNNGLVQLAQKEFSAFLQHAADSAGKVNNIIIQSQIPILDF